MYLAWLTNYLSGSRLALANKNGYIRLHVLLPPRFAIAAAR
jgi:hypothetical protein